MRAWQRSGHESGRGHGPGGRIKPMAGDILEVLARGEWKLAQVAAIGFAHWVLPIKLRADDGEVFQVGQADFACWRWPHRHRGTGPCCPACDAPGAQPETEMDDLETAEQCERCGGYADNCPCPKGNA